MLYLSVFVLLAICAVFSILSKTNNMNTILFYLMFIILTLMLCFRYGQGTDYFNYMNLFKHYSNWNNVINSNDHGEFGFRLLCFIFKDDFELFIFCISLCQMFMLYRFILLNSVNHNLSLFLFYPTFYLIYYFSGIRQGLVMSIFIGIAYPLFQNKKFVKYIISILLLTSIHTVALVYLLILLIPKLKISTIIFLLSISFTIGIIGLVLPFDSLFAKVPFLGNALIDNSGTSFSILATLERIIMLIAILFLYKSNVDTIAPKIKNMLKIYLFGYVVYFMFLPFATLATRVMICFKIFEIIIVPYFVMNRNSFKYIFIIFIFALTGVSYFHNISALISQGNYFSSVNLFNYPYFSIFKKEDILNCRDIVGEFLD